MYAQMAIYFCRCSQIEDDDQEIDAVMYSHSEDDDMSGMAN